MGPIAVDSRTFRHVLGQYPTGVVVVTATRSTGEPVGMTVGSFTSVSLDPPLVAFLPSKTSSSWNDLRASGDRFCINVLASTQEDVCRSIAMRKVDKFSDIPWTMSSSGNPVVDGAVAYIDCATQQIHDAGDHEIVIGRVLDVAVKSSDFPLLFFRGGYGSFSPLSLAAADADLLELLRLVDLARPHMDQLAARLETEVTAVCLVRDELVLAAAAGHAHSSVVPTRVGQRVPFMPPLGSTFAAWGGDAVRERWLGNLGDGAGARERDEFSRSVDRVRDRGHALGFSHERGAQFETISAQFNLRHPGVSDETLRAAVRTLGDYYNPVSYRDDSRYELRWISAPVFHADGMIAFSLTLWGPPGTIDRHQVDEFVRELSAAASAATDRICSLERPVGRS